MHVRVTIFEGEADRTDELIAFVRDRGVAHVRSLEGNLGLTMTADREAGRCEVAVPFTSLDTLLASTGAVGPMRDVGDAIMTAQPDPEVFRVHDGLSHDDLTGRWHGTWQLEAAEGLSAGTVEPLMGQVARALDPHPEVQLLECRTNESSATLIVAGDRRSDLEAALDAARPACVEAGHPVIGATTQEIVIDAAGPASDRAAAHHLQDTP